MAKHDKTLLGILRGGSDALIGFGDLRVLIPPAPRIRRESAREPPRALQEFFTPGIEELVNLQKPGSKAKPPYQVRQVRNFITRHGLGGAE